MRRQSRRYATDRVGSRGRPLASERRRFCDWRVLPSTQHLHPALGAAGGSRPSPAYTPKAPAQGVLYQMVRDHFEAFRAEAARVYERAAAAVYRGRVPGIPALGFLAGGFARFHCGRCGLDRLVPFSCKGRAICPSCGGRRMADRAADLVDDVFPVVPVRPWVLSLPHRRRYVPAAHQLAVGGVDAAKFRLRRPRVSTLRGSARARRALKSPLLRCVESVANGVPRPDTETGDEHLKTGHMRSAPTVRPG